MRAHADQALSSYSDEVDNIFDEIDTFSDQPRSEVHLCDAQVTSNDPSNVESARTPTTITIAEVNVEGEPVRVQVGDLSISSCHQPSV